MSAVRQAPADAPCRRTSITGAPVEGTTVAEPLTIQSIWAGMPDSLAATVLAEVRQETADLYREAQVIAASALRMRPQVLRQQPAAKQASAIRRVLTQVGREDLGGRLLVEWLTKRHKPMLALFLDDLGIAHEDGIVNDELGAEPATEHLTAAIRRLHAEFPAEQVRVYLQTFAITTGYEWGSLPDLIDQPLDEALPPEAATNEPV